MEIRRIINFFSPNGKFLLDEFGSKNRKRDKRQDIDPSCKSEHLVSK